MPKTVFPETVVKLAQGAGIAVILSAVAFLIWLDGGFNRWEFKTWDWRASHYSKPAPTTDQIRLIFLDQYSLDWGSSSEMKLPWPWPREVYAPIVDYCRRAGAKVVAFDVLFTEASYRGVEDDAVLAEAIAASRGFVGAVFLGNENLAETRWPAAVSPAPYSRILVAPETETLLAAVSFRRAKFPIPEIASNATLLANVSANPNMDGVYRRACLVNRFDQQFVPALGLGAYLAGLVNPNLKLEPGWLHVGDKAIPLDAGGRAILRFRGPSQTHKTVNAAAVIQSELACREGKPPLIPLDFFRDRYVLFGFTAPGLYDLRSAPVAGVYPGVEIHATMLDDLLAGDFMRDASPETTAAVVLALALLGAVAIRFCRNTWQTVLAFLVFIPIPGLLGVYAYQHGVWLPIVVQWVALVPAMVVALGVNYATEGRQKRFIKGAFQQYLSPDVIDQMIQNPALLRLGGQERELTIFFSDIKSFTSISERLKPEQLTDLLNRYLTAMTDIIRESGGTLDKYIGDAIVAFWNAPLEQKDHAARGVRAALKCGATLAEMRSVLETEFGAKLYARIGMNTGKVVVGNMGSQQHFAYSFLGDAGNLASRLEGINKQFGTYFLISQFTREQLGDDFCGREISKVTVVGRKEPVRIYEPVSEEQFAARRSLYASFEQALQAYYAGRFAEAAESFAALEADDPTSAIYARRCRDLLANPPTAWDGVWNMTEK